MTTKTNGCGAMGCDGGWVTLSFSRVPCLECQPTDTVEDAIARTAEAIARHDGVWASETNAAIRVKAKDHATPSLMEAMEELRRVVDDGARVATEELPPGFQWDRDGDVLRMEEFFQVGATKVTGQAPLTRAEAVAKAWEVYRREHAGGEYYQVKPLPMGAMSPGDRATIGTSPSSRLAQVEALMNPGEGLAPLITRADALNLLNMPEVDTRHTYGPESSRKAAPEPTIEVGDYVERAERDETIRGTVTNVYQEFPEQGRVDVDSNVGLLRAIPAFTFQLLRKAGDIRVGDVVRADIAGPVDMTVRKVCGEWLEGTTAAGGLAGMWAPECTLVQLAPSTDSAKVDT